MAVEVGGMPVVDPDDRIPKYAQADAKKLKCTSTHMHAHTYTCMQMQSCRLAVAIADPYARTPHHTPMAQPWPPSVYENRQDPSAARPLPVTLMREVVASGRSALCWSQCLRPCSKALCKLAGQNSASLAIAVPADRRQQRGPLPH